MAENNEQKPKIIVDDDWKAQAQAEKERLAQEVESNASQAKQASQAAGLGEEDGEQLPEASFSALISSLVTQVRMALGGMADPQSGKRYVDLELAKFHVDMLSVLEAKTRGNLEEDEKKMLDRALYETRVHYVQVAQAVSAQLAQQAKDGGQGGGPTGLQA